MVFWQNISKKNSSRKSYSSSLLYYYYFPMWTGLIWRVSEPTHACWRHFRVTSHILPAQSDSSNQTAGSHSPAHNRCLSDCTRLHLKEEKKHMPRRKWKTQAMKIMRQHRSRGNWKTQVNGKHKSLRHWKTEDMKIVIKHKWLENTIHEDTGRQKSRRNRKTQIMGKLNNTSQAESENTSYGDIDKQRS